MDLQKLAEMIKQWGLELGFQQVGITDVDLSQHEAYLQSWLDNGYHGDMEWMARHGMMRARPGELHQGTVRAICVRMDYLPEDAQFASNLRDTSNGYISRYALGRDYHKLIRKKLSQLGKQIEAHFEGADFRPFVDSAPILERPLAQKAGLGWTGKHSLLINPDSGSWFFLGELLVNLPLPTDEQIDEQCGKCRSCITSCPTDAIVDDNIVDARRCISYLTIEYEGVIPEEFRAAMGNRIYGCDDCQLVCPYNRESPLSEQADFQRKSVFNNSDLVHLLKWDEPTFLDNLQGSAIRRIGHKQWRRNLIIAMGNAPFSHAIVEALTSIQGIDPLWDAHIEWALARQKEQAQPNGKQQRLIRIIEKGLPRDA
ncbi:tRNA epoxyqueuosine(34) reductase QueG [Vibrio ulleungensis]|uniref:Epoxyqueuosine reductase n=1 Tax=Vibrio ulleungensis TaxID=2807619 RepID=A0ABS2HMK2_9VIBR|nr:tRNA epoxyqueuosine(34) reductase QueG [Vibrio ulleungensis]MBM7038269.1 tRNA epoxyqueuosine(34) reductase QueG [Vibrio ulleungensis]